MLIRQTSFFTLFLILLLASCGPSPEEQLQQSRTLVQQGKYAEAIRQLDALLEDEPTQADAYNMRGVAYLESGDIQNAISDFSQAVKYQPDDYRYWYNRANARNEAKEWAASLEDYNKAIELRPETADAYLNRSSVLYEMNNMPAALQDIKLAIKQAPDNPLVQLNAGKIYYSLDSLPQARRHLTETIRLDKRRAEAFYLLGNIMRSQGEPQEACTLYKQAAQLGSEPAKEAANSCS